MFWLPTNHEYSESQICVTTTKDDMNKAALLRGANIEVKIEDNPRSDQFFLKPKSLVFVDDSDTPI